VMRLGLLTGRRIERPSASGVRPGLEFRPHLVATVKFEGIVHEPRTGRLSLRDPKIAMMRADKTAFEADEISMLDRLYLDQRLS
jgi:DNA ligase 1